MPQRNNTKRREEYAKNKEEINRKRRARNNTEEFKYKKRLSEKIYRDKNKEKISEYNKSFSRKVRERCKELVFNHYGRKCECCGENHIEFLTIDHMNGNGRKHRKEINNKLYPWLIKNNYPEEFKTLCLNCNFGRYKNNGICPHKL